MKKIAIMRDYCYIFINLLTKIQAPIFPFFPDMPCLELPRIHTGFKLVIDRLLKQSIANELHPHEMDAALRIELII